MDLTKSAQLLDHALQNGVFPCYAAAIGQGKDIWFYNRKDIVRFIRKRLF